MKRIGIIGAGQLGQMLGYAANGMGIECVFLDPSDNPPAASTGPVLKFAFDDAEGLAELVARTDLITYEFENVPVEAILQIVDTTNVYPPPQALRHAQDRLVEKNLFRTLGIPVANFKAVDSEDDLRAAGTEIGFPIVLKTRRLGYDGKGQTIVSSDTEIASAFAALGGEDLIAEQMVPFDCEVSAIGVRNPRGEFACYPLSENRHEGGILRLSTAPAGSAALNQRAQSYLLNLLEHLDYVGVLALELFVVDGELLANEFAPRVHNSGHWTIEGAQTSQFANHLRAILDMSPGSTEMRGYAAMVNLIGEIPAGVAEIGLPGCQLHNYGKAPRPGRKLGHISVVAEDEDARSTILDQLAKLLKN
jgi:5-(carboxyamino)imidazole ribonucleotide synthase